MSARRQKMTEIWQHMNLRRKFYVVISSIGIVILIAVFLNLKVVYSFTNNVSNTLNDNLLSYKVQEALQQEAQAFKDLIVDRNEETTRIYEFAVQNTQNQLLNLPFEYDTIGENRYAITWNIMNAYGEYEGQRDKILMMSGTEPEYVENLYNIYEMQDYLDTYATALIQETLIAGNIAYQEKIPQLKRMPFTLIVISVCVYLPLFVALHFMTRSMVEILTQMSEEAKRIRKSDFSAPDIVWKSTDEIGELVSDFNLMKRATQESQQIKEELYKQSIEKIELEQRFSLSQLQLLKSQLNPHFMFNTLNMIARMSQLEEAPVTEEMIIAMSNLLRYSLRTTNEFAPIEQELKIVQDYMYIQEMRFGSRIKWELECDDEVRNLEIPVFLLQPLVENAMVHGISPKEEGGIVKVKIQKDTEMLYISVSDTGVGIPLNNLEKIRTAIKEKCSISKLGIGLGNISQRIKAYYEYGEIEIESEENFGTVINLQFEVRRENTNDVQNNGG